MNYFINANYVSSLHWEDNLADATYVVIQPTASSPGRGFGTHFVSDSCTLLIGFSEHPPIFAANFDDAFDACKAIDLIQADHTHIKSWCRYHTDCYSPLVKPNYRSFTEVFVTHSGYGDLYKAYRAGEVMHDDPKIQKLATANSPWYLQEAFGTGVLQEKPDDLDRLGSPLVEPKSGQRKRSPTFASL